MKLVVIESPYGSLSDEVVARNLRYLSACMRDCLTRGEAPYASHGLYTRAGVLDDRNPSERVWGINAGFAWRKHADLTVVYTNLGITWGMRQGIAHAENIGCPIERRDLVSSWEEQS